jgi:protein TBF1
VLEAQNTAETLLDRLGLFLHSYLAIITDYAERYGVNIPSNNERENSLALYGQLGTEVNGQAGWNESSFGTMPPALGQTPMMAHASINGLQQKAASNNGTDTLGGAPRVGDSLFEEKGLAALIEEKLSALDGPAHGTPFGTVNNFTDGSAYAQSYPAYDQAYYPYSATSNLQPEPAESSSGNPLPPNQTFPTSILYERAKQASVAKTSAHARREGIHSTRRPWSSEEEKALMMGLDMVKGPHWSQILGIFGHNGTISDILKDRTQVQLKDKARNLKLFFLKTNSEMPYYLQCVTGELKTRAPSQAARREAEDKARMNSEEEQARLAGIMTLAGGLQNSTGGNTVANMMPSPAYAAASSRTVTPAPAAPAPAVPAPPARLGPSPIQPLSAIPSPRYLAAALANQPGVAQQASQQQQLPQPAAPANLAPAIKREPAEALTLPRSASSIQPTVFMSADVRASAVARSTPPAPVPTVSAPAPSAATLSSHQRPAASTGISNASVSAPAPAVPVSLPQSIPPVAAPAATAIANAASNTAAPVTAAQVATEPASDASDALQEANMVQALRAVVAGP